VLDQFSLAKDKDKEAARIARINRPREAKGGGRET